MKKEKKQKYEWMHLMEIHDAMLVTYSYKDDQMKDFLSSLQHFNEGSMNTFVTEHCISRCQQAHT